VLKLGGNIMSNSYISLYIHAVFRTKNNTPWIDASIKERLYSYLGGIAHDNHMKLLAAGGIADHVHILLSLPADMAISKALQTLKGGSSKWVHETFPQLPSFGWQEGYGAFSIGVSQIEATTTYIAHQEEHHRETNFHDEYVAFLRKHNLLFEEQYL